eukprot:4910870-Amphidinium_carterae.1
MSSDGGAAANGHDMESSRRLGALAIEYNCITNDSCGLLFGHNSPVTLYDQALSKTYRRDSRSSVSSEMGTEAKETRMGT